MGMVLVRLDSETDFEAWRNYARQLLLAGTPPEQVTWQGGDAAQSLFGEQALRPADSPLPASALRVPRRFFALCQTVILHRDVYRFALMYRALWRLQQEPGLMQVAFDPDIARLEEMAKAVKRDMHKMKAFVRFREIGQANSVVYIAWFEPEHHILAALASFFVNRFTHMEWSILTPAASMHWRNGQLHFGEGATFEALPPDNGGEDLWRTYYSHIFNPARLKLQAMQAQMPKKYWRSLPEAPLIATLAAQALSDTARMITAAPQLPKRKVVKYQPIRSGRTHEEDDRSARNGNMNARDRLNALMRDMEAHPHFPLAAQATQLVPGEGPVPALIMLVGEQPGDKEDIAGKPFVGPAGKMLSKALADAGLDREQCYITNAVKHFEFRLANGRRRNITPTSSHISDYRPWLMREIDIVQPKLIIALGGVACEALLGRKQPILSNRGKIFNSPANKPVLQTVHPSSILRAGSGEEVYQAFVHDLIKAKQALEGPGLGCG